MSKVIYIVGSGRSGSTILDLSLASNKNISGLGEVHRLSLNPNERTCGCGEVISKCDFWKEIVFEYAKGNVKDWEINYPVTLLSKRKQVFGKQLPRIFDILAMLLTPRLVSFFSQIFSNYFNAKFSFVNNSFNLFRSVSKKTGAKFVVDSSKNALRAKLLYLLRPESVYIIHLVRDGRAIVESAKRRVNIDVVESTSIWKRVNRNIEFALYNVPDKRKLRVKYEDFCKSPASVLENINTFISNGEHDFDLESLEHCKHHQIPGNPLLRSTVKGIKLVESWKERLSEDEISEFKAIAGNLNKKYGYD